MVHRIKGLAVLLAALFLPLLPSSFAADAPIAPEIRLDTPSGLPVPRFVSLKSNKTNCRIGPSFAHPVRMTYMRKGLPVVVIAESNDHWRKIRDYDSDQCWVHKSKLSGVDTGVIALDGASLRARPAETAVEIAKLGAGIVAKIERSKDDWRRVTVEDRRGWVRADALWGARDIDLASR